MPYTLAPCATCGHPTPRLADSVHWTEDTDSLVWLGICDHCKALGPVAPTPERAAKLWDEKQAFTISIQGPPRPAPPRLERPVLVIAGLLVAAVAALVALLLFLQG